MLESPSLIEFSFRGRKPTGTVYNSKLTCESLSMTAEASDSGSAFDNVMRNEVYGVVVKLAMGLGLTMVLGTGSILALFM